MPVKKPSTEAHSRQRLSGRLKRCQKDATLLWTPDPGCVHFNQCYDLTFFFSVGDERSQNFNQTATATQTHMKPSRAAQERSRNRRTEETPTWDYPLCPFQEKLARRLLGIQMDNLITKRGILLINEFKSLLRILKWGYQQAAAFLPPKFPCCLARKQGIPKPRWLQSIQGVCYNESSKGIWPWRERKTNKKLDNYQEYSAGWVTQYPVQACLHDKRTANDELAHQLNLQAKMTAENERGGGGGHDRHKGYLFIRPFIHSPLKGRLTSLTQCQSSQPVSVADGCWWQYCAVWFYSFPVHWDNKTPQPCTIRKDWNEIAHMHDKVSTQFADQIWKSRSLSEE